jgi:cytochrome c5
MKERHLSRNGVLGSGLLTILCLLTVGCPQKTQQNAHPDPHLRFANYKGGDCDGIPGELPNHYGYYLTKEQLDGACTWYLWTGGDPLRTEGSPENARGNPRFWRLAEKRLMSLSDLLELPIDVNLMNYVTGTPRDQRFAKHGTINDPGCKKATKPDAYGLMLDDCQDPYSSGVMGIRLFPNPNFNPKIWDAQKYLSPNHDPNMEPPYLAGLTCGLCHIAFNPDKPPADPENPQWENLAPAFGNQYLREGEMFKGRLQPKHFLYWVYDTQPPGTSDTSRMSTDFINNPNAINSIWYILSARPKHPEVMNDGTTQAVPHILKDGSDSTGPANAGLRVYINIGSCPDYRYSLEDTFTGILRPFPQLPMPAIPTSQHPFDLNKAQKDCVDWQLTSARIDKAAAFLDAVQPYPLSKAPGGGAYLKASPAVMDLGKQVFAENCARCHSSKVPDEVNHGFDKHSDAAKPAWVRLVKSSDFLDKNFLSDDDRYPLVSHDSRIAIGTNANRALGTNPIEEHLWQNFSSRTFKQLPPPGAMTLENPFNEKKPINFPITHGGYYRTPSLINVWATAPFFQNNSLGVFTGDPSVQGRMTAFNDAVEKLLWPEKRLGKKSIRVTGADSDLNIRDIAIRIPAGTPVDLLANINVLQAITLPEVMDEFKRLQRNPDLLVKLVHAFQNTGQYDSELETFVPELLRLSQSPDLIEDHGHLFGTTLPNDQKHALIEYMKTF